jgi:hypothetical protein
LHYVRANEELVSHVSVFPFVNYTVYEKIDIAIGDLLASQYSVKGYATLPDGEDAPYPREGRTWIIEDIR